PGSIVTGWASDRFDLRIVILASTLCAALSTFFLWGFSNSLAQLIPFALLYGFSAGGWSSTWSRFGSAVGGENMKVSSTAFSLMGSSRGIGNLLAGPISSALLKTGGLHYGAKNYVRTLVFFDATTMADWMQGCTYFVHGCNALGLCVRITLQADWMRDFYGQTWPNEESTVTICDRTKVRKLYVDVLRVRIEKLGT
ncbi:hypothetical protein EXIGLDRAFT_692946, partial [Exidia glandulosa HHB12029]